MELQDAFRKGLIGGWVCKRGIRLELAGGKQIRFRPGQEIYAGEYHVAGGDLVAELEMLAEPLAGLAVARHQQLRDALAA